MKYRKVAIIGGGPAGAFAALLLARRGWPVTVYDVRGPNDTRPGVETLRAEVPALLQRYGADSCIAGGVPSPGSWSDWGGVSERHAIMNPHGAGAHVDRASFRAELIRLAMAAGAEFRFRVRADVTRTPGGWAITTGAGSDHAHDLLVATGRDRAPLPQARKATPLDSLVTLLATIPVARADLRLSLGATPHGWWYVCPASGGSTQLGFCSDGDLLRMLLRDPEWKAAIPHGTWRLVSSSSLPPQFPAAVDCLPIGDAAGARDPLAGDGVLRALESAESAVAVLEQPLERRGEAAADFAGEMTRRYARYIDLRQELYASERRWTDFPFWRRRAMSASSWSVNARGVLPEI